MKGLNKFQISCNMIQFSVYTVFLTKTQTVAFYLLIKHFIARLVVKPFHHKVVK